MTHISEMSSQYITIAARATSINWPVISHHRRAYCIGGSKDLRADPIRGRREGKMQLPGDDVTATALAHVLWLGGASDSGKSTVARLLAERHRWQIYPCDFHEHKHLIARADPERHPVIYAEFRKT